MADGLGTFDVTFDADSSRQLRPYGVEAADGTGSVTASYEVVAPDVLSLNPPTGDVLRTYRLALITDPGYSDFFGGPANVTAAKVTLMNRVVHVYEDDISIHMDLVANNDLLNFEHVGGRRPARTARAAPRPASRSRRSPAAPRRRAPGS